MINLNIIKYFEWFEKILCVNAQPGNPNESAIKKRADRDNEIQSKYFLSTSSLFLFFSKLDIMRDMQMSDLLVE
jgi:hypothetical protein